MTEPRNEPFVTRELAQALSAMGSELQKSYDDVSNAVTEFVNSFLVIDSPLLVAALEQITTAMKENFNEHEKMLYRLVVMPGTSVVVMSKRIRKEGE